MAERESTQIGQIHALISRGTSFRGTLAFEGRARVDGTLEGDVIGDGILVVGEGASISAKIDVGTLIVLGGTVRGTANARDLIEIHAAARVSADISAPEVDIQKGATFEGRCTMTGAAAGEAPAGRTAEAPPEPEGDAPSAAAENEPAASSSEAD